MVHLLILRLPCKSLRCMVCCGVYETIMRDRLTFEVIFWTVELYYTYRSITVSLAMTVYLHRTNVNAWGRALARSNDNRFTKGYTTFSTVARDFLLKNVTRALERTNRHTFSLPLKKECLLEIRNLFSRKVHCAHYSSLARVTDRIWI